MSSVLARATVFLDGFARPLERRLFDVAFRDGNAADVRQALVAYRNADGGFGLALESDLRAPTSQPLFLQSALCAWREAELGADAEFWAPACDWLAGLADERGAVPYVLPDAMEHERARHWNGDFALARWLHPTAGLAAGLRAVGARHEWIDRATAWCLEEIAGDPEYSGHCLLNVLDLLEQNDADDQLWTRATTRLLADDHVQIATPVTSYALTPLHFALTPDVRARPLFADDVIAAHLDDLLARQQDDGGWPLFWSPPPGAATNEWRGRWTLEALHSLRAYGRI